MDTNGVENAIRPVPLTSKNELFAGSVDGAKTWAIASLIGTCRLDGISPEAYIAATIRRFLDLHMQSDIPELMPWNFRGEPSRPSKGDPPAPAKGDWFDAHVARVLAPTVRAGDVVVMDNLTCHKRASVRAVI